MSNNRDITWKEYLLETQKLLVEQFKGTVSSYIKFINDLLIQFRVPKNEKV